MSLLYVEDLNVTENLKIALSHLDTITDYHQAIMDIAYENLKSMEDPEKPGTYTVPTHLPRQPWSHALLVNTTKDSYGELAAFAVLMGKYNQQVCNGGHLQYWENHYASYGDITDDISLHHQLRSLYDFFTDDVKKVLNLSEEEYSHVVLRAAGIMQAFQDQLELEPKYEAKRLISDEDGEIYEFDSEDYNSEFGMPTQWCIDHWEYQDKFYYEIQEQLMTILENYFEKKIKLL